jgi:hypothetical protein
VTRIARVTVVAQQRYLLRVAVAAAGNTGYAATKLLDQNLWMIPTPTAIWLRDDDGEPFWPSPMLAVASMIVLPLPASV